MMTVQGTERPAIHRKGEDTMTNIIETQDLCKTYGDHTAVDHLDLRVPEGSVYGFIGPNGAGKSTTMKMLLGLIHPTRGTVRLRKTLLSRSLQALRVTRINHAFSCSSLSKGLSWSRYFRNTV